MQDTLPGLKLFKPEGTEIVHRVYSPSPSQFAMSFGLLTPFALLPPGHAVEEPAAATLWERVAKVLEKDQILDESWPKPNGELLASGHCYMPEGHTDQPVAVSISAGDITKRLAVFGDRHFSSGGISAPQPFQRMALTLANAFGGQEYQANPAGKGLDPQQGVTPLPNVEYPNQLMLSPGDRPAPAGFGPLPIAYPQRARYLGTSDQRWRDTRWPHLPEDTDARYFMAAPDDQQLQGFWSGGEPVAVRNMHPQHPELSARVPGTRTRFFVHQSDADGQARFRELNVNLDTLWLLPEEQLGLAVFRGSIPVADGTGYDVNAFYAVFEDPASEPYPLEFYLTQCLRMMAPEVFKDLPDPNAPDYKAELEQMDEGKLIQKLREHRDYFQVSLKSAGMREDELLKQLEANPHTRQFAQTIVQRNGSLTGFFNEIENLLKIIQNPDAAASAMSMLSGGKTLNDALTPYPRPAPMAAQSPPTQTAAAPLHDASAAARNRQMVINAQRTGQSCAQLDLSHANLAGLELAGMDFTGAILAGANFAGAQLQGACLDAVFASNTRFDAADLSGCRMRQASLGQASFVGANLRGADLQASDCSDSNFSGAELSGSNLQAAVLAGAWLQSIRAERLIADNAQLINANLDGANLAGARLANANLSGASAQRINLEGTAAAKINLTQADLSGANLQQADLSGSQTGPGTSLKQARLNAAQLECSSWTGVDLDQAWLTGIQAKDTDFSDSNLTAARISRSDLRGCRFDRSNLQGADLSLSNLMQASFMNANLRSGKFQGCNLYGATFVDTDIAGAQFNDANLDCTVLAT